MVGPSDDPRQVTFSELLLAEVEREAASLPQPPRRVRPAELACDVDGHPSDLAKRTASALLARGIIVRLDSLAKRTVTECVDALNWAVSSRSDAVMPAWLPKRRR